MVCGLRRPRVCGVACPDEGDAWHAAAAQSQSRSHARQRGLVVIMAASPISFSDPPVSERAAVTITEQVLFRLRSILRSHVQIRASEVETF